MDIIIFGRQIIIWATFHCQAMTARSALVEQHDMQLSRLGRHIIKWSQ
jgi:hypothetical protein